MLLNTPATYVAVEPAFQGASAKGAKNNSHTISISDGRNRRRPMGLVIVASEGLEPQLGSLLAVAGYSGGGGGGGGG